MKKFVPRLRKQESSGQIRASYFSDLEDVGSASPWLNACNTAHRLIFLWLYGGHIEVDEVNKVRSLYARHHLSLISFQCDNGVAFEFDCIAEAIAYDDFYGMLPEIAPRIAQDIVNFPGICKAIARLPRFWVAIGMQLHDESIFTDSLKHLVGKHCFGACNGPRCPWGIPDPLPDAFEGFNDHDLEALILRKRDKLMWTAVDIMEHLRTIGIELLRDWSTVGRDTSYFKVCTFTGNRMPKSKDRVSFLVSSIFREWLDVETFKAGGCPKLGAINYNG